MTCWGCYPVENPPFRDDVAITHREAQGTFLGIQSWVDQKEHRRSESLFSSAILPFVVGECPKSLGTQSASSRMVAAAKQAAAMFGVCPEK